MTYREKDPMDDLVQWLREQLDEDERTAQEASGWIKPAAYWSLDEWYGRERPHSLIAQGSPELPVAGGHFTADPVPTVQAEHIARHDPARVLREIDAKRKLLDKIVNEVAEFDGMDPMTTMINPDVGDDLLKLLALPYADRPGYRGDWRP